MAKTKRRSRKEATRGKSAERGTLNNKQAEHDDKPDHRDFVEPNPPRPNLTMLVISAVLVVGWLVYLLIVATFGR